MSKAPYNFATIEKKWQQYWEKNKTFIATTCHTKQPKYYVLDMFPYPSGQGLHVGHPLGYVATDIVARYHHSKGYNVLHPMGFDAFGLPAEQYAIQTGQHPAITTKKNIATYRKQLQQLGLAIDWSREVCTSEPKYYRWTQWIFLQFFNSWYNKKTDQAASIDSLKYFFEREGNINVQAACDEDTPIFTAKEWAAMSEKKQQQQLLHYRLAFLAPTLVNWCPELGTVLANDEVKDGLSERGGYPVVRKKMLQWNLRITAYANRLLSDLTTLDWPQPIKDIQRHWIGKSVGAEISFSINLSPSLCVDVFTTRPDTIFGATYIALAPEHPLVATIIKIQDTQIAKATQEPLTIEKLTTLQQKLKSYIATSATQSARDRMLKKDITGVATTLYAVHPFTGKMLPIWVTDYVLPHYGKGAIMGVPAHDTRDYAFAKRFKLPVLEVIERDNSLEGAYEAKEGKLINSHFLDNLSVEAAIKKAISHLEKTGKGVGKVHYRLHDAIFGRQRYWGEPFPIYYKVGNPYPFEETELPLELPSIDYYEPTETGDPPLARVKGWHKAPNEPIEYSTMPAWAGSSWYFLRYMDPHNTQEFVSKEAIGYWKAVDLYVGGAEHTTGHLLYARFFTKFLYDLGYISIQEPFTKFINQGMIQGISQFVYRIKGTNKFVSYGLKDQYNTIHLHVAIRLVEKGVLDIEAFKKWRKDFSTATFILEEGKYYCGKEVEKMSKSKHNVINPDEVIATYGTDSLRLYLMFLGPLAQAKPWNMQGIEGVSKFLAKVWRLFHHKQGTFYISEEEATKQERKAIHQAIKHVEEAIVRYSFNTAISGLMICVNTLTALQCHKVEVLKDLVCLLAPFAPHIAEELWALMGKKASVSKADFPSYDPTYLATSTIVYPIAINGKVRAKLRLSTTATKKEVELTALASVELQKWLQGITPKKVIVVPKRIVNIVI